MNFHVSSSVSSKALEEIPFSTFSSALKFQSKKSEAFLSFNILIQRTKSN
jgi:hypothetical protein